jgi:hypothetical protein
MQFRGIARDGAAEARGAGQRAGHPRSVRRSRVVVAVLVLAAGALALSGCVPSSSAPTPSRSATPSAKPTSTRSPKPPSSSTPSPSATPAPPASGPTPLKLGCDQVLSLDQVYAYNPNFVPDSNYSPAGASDAAKAVAGQGVACGWVNETSGSELMVAMSEPSPATLAAAKRSAATGAPVSGDGATGYFSVRGGVGEAQLFTGSFWVVIASADFGVAGDVTPLIQPVIGNLPPR